jgi:hypothetical protein
VGRTIGTGSPWQRSPDLKDLILRRLAHHHHRIDAIDGRASWPAENGAFDVLRREQSIPHTMLRCRRILRRGHWIQRYRMTAMLKKNVKPSATLTSCIEHLSSFDWYIWASSFYTIRLALACPRTPVWGALHALLRACLWGGSLSKRGARPSESGETPVRRRTQEGYAPSRLALCEASDEEWLPTC